MKIYGDMANGEGFACMDKKPLETKVGNKPSPWVQGFLHSGVHKLRGQRQSV